MSLAFACPSCEQPYTVADDAAGKTTRCKRCGTAFKVLGPAPVADYPEASFEPIVSPPRFSSVGEQAPTPFTKKPAFLIAAIFLIVVCILAAGLLVAGGPAKLTSKSSRLFLSDYPYKECEEIVAWLRNNVHDPNGLEIVEWQSRREFPMNNATRPNGGVGVDIYVRYRAKNVFGAKVINRASFHFYDGKFGDVIHR